MQGDPLLNKSNDLAILIFLIMFQVYNGLFLKMLSMYKIFWYSIYFTTTCLLKIVFLIIIAFEFLQISNNKGLTLGISSKVSSNFYENENFKNKIN